METEIITFWLGLIASGEGNAFCNCGAETDRTALFGIHVADGTGRMRLACPTCARRYADQLSRLANITPPPIRIGDLPLGRNAAKYELFAIEEPTACEDFPIEETPLGEPETVTT